MPTPRSDESVDPAPAAAPAEVTDPLIVTFLSPGYDLDGLRAAHSKDAARNCAVCGGPQSGRTAWPCLTRIKADEAESIRRLSGVDWMKPKRGDARRGR